MLKNFLLTDFQPFQKQLFLFYSENARTLVEIPHSNYHVAWTWILRNYLRAFYSCILLYENGASQFHISVNKIR